MAVLFDGQQQFWMKKRLADGELKTDNAMKSVSTARTATLKRSLLGNWSASSSNFPAITCCQWKKWEAKMVSCPLTSFSCTPMTLCMSSQRIILCALQYSRRSRNLDSITQCTGQPFQWSERISRLIKKGMLLSPESPKHKKLWRR
jgi:hypothetical protein